MIQVYLLAVGELRRQMEKMACIKDAAALPGWDKLADWQQEKIMRCAAPGARALCMGGQLLLQYGAYERAGCVPLLQSESCGKKNVPGDPDAGSSAKENRISWRIIDFARLPEHIHAPQPLAVAYEPKGKPYILRVPWHYNLSHSGDYVALAVSDASVGIDIQQMRPYRDSLVKRFFSAEEAAVYESLVSMDGQNTPAGACAGSTDVQGRNTSMGACADTTDVPGQKADKQRLSGSGATLFYTLWCRKEAYGKLLGTGLTEDVLKCNMLEDVGVHLYEYGELPGYRSCVCSRDR